MKLDKEEKELIESFENEEWESVLTEEEIKKYKSYAENTLKQTKKIELKLSDKELLILKEIANINRVPFDVLVSSIVHKYIQQYQSK